MHRYLMTSVAFASTLAIALAAEKGDGGGGKNAADKAADAAAAAAAAEAAKTPTAQANTTNGGGALNEADQVHDGEFTDLTAANLAVIDLREQLAAQKIEHENTAADLRSQATTAERALDDLKARMVSGTLTTTQRDQAGDAAAALNDGERIDEAAAAEELFDVRVKTPMLVQPPEPDWRHDGPPPTAFPLAKGLNKVPRWVAEHWIVRANLEPDPA